MSGKRQHNQNQLAFGSSGQVKLVSSDRKGPERLWWREKPKARMESFASVGSKSQLIRTAVYGTVRTVVWEGRTSVCPPYPDPQKTMVCPTGILPKPLLPAIQVVDGGFD
jgi:hypothetical protein